MPPPPSCFAAVLGLLAVSVAAEEPAKTRPSESIAHEAIKGFKFQPPATRVETSAVLQQPQPADAPVMMSVYTVRALPDQTFKDVSEALAQQERLRSPALIQLKKIPLEFILPPKFEPDSAGQPRLRLDIINLRW